MNQNDPLLQMEHISKAFSGELVPTEAELARAEGRTYETAEELLTRIRGARVDKPDARLLSVLDLGHAPQRFVVRAECVDSAQRG